MRRFYGPGNKMMVFGTGERTEDGDLRLSDSAKRRADYAAEIYYNHSFNRKGEDPSILLTGGYGKKEFTDKPPIQREAQLMARYLIELYAIPKRALLIEDESTDTKGNYINSLEAYPEFFEIIEEKRLGLVSQASHLDWVVEAGADILEVDEGLKDSGGWYRALAAREPIEFAKPIASVEELQQEAIRLAAD